MRVLCVLGFGVKVSLTHVAIQRLFYFPRDQCPLLSTLVIQPLYLFADRKLKTWLYYVKVLVKLFPLHGVGWYKLCGMFSELLQARRDMQRVVRVPGLLCYPAFVFTVAGPLTCPRMLRT